MIKKFQKDNLVIIKNDRNGNEYFRVHLVSDPNNVGYQGYLMEKLTANKQPTGEFITVIVVVKVQKERQKKRE